MPPKKTAVKAQPAAAKPAAKSQKTVKKVADEDEEDDDDMEDDDEEEEADAASGMDEEVEEEEDEEAEEEEEEEAKPTKAKNGLQAKGAAAAEADEDEEEEGDEEEEEEEEEEEAEDEDDEGEGDAPQKKKGAAATPGSKDKKKAGKAGQEASTPKTGKRKADDDYSGGGSDAKKLKLEDYIPESCIDSLEKKNSCSLIITLGRDARASDITDISGDIINLALKGDKAFARYIDEETAEANLEVFEQAVGQGKVVHVERCSAPHESDAQGNMLDVFRVPFDCSVNQLKKLFPGSRVFVLNDGFARLHFQSTEQLLSAVQNPECHTIGGNSVRFSLVKKFGGQGGF
ncbi:unnamed protein product, partial [Ixodes pacificus]